MSESAESSGCHIVIRSTMCSLGCGLGHENDSGASGSGKQGMTPVV